MRLAIIFARGRLHPLTASPNTRRGWPSAGNGARRDAERRPDRHRAGHRDKQPPPEDHLHVRCSHILSADKCLPIIACSLGCLWRRSGAEEPPPSPPHPADCDLLPHFSIFNAWETGAQAEVRHMEQHCPQSPCSLQNAQTPPYNTQKPKQHRSPSCRRNPLITTPPPPSPSATVHRLPLSNGKMSAKVGSK